MEIKAYLEVVLKHNKCMKYEACFTRFSVFASDAPKREVYFMGVIDILTPYDAKKKAAHAAKTVKHGVGISAIDSHIKE